MSKELFHDFNLYAEHPERTTLIDPITSSAVETAIEELSEIEKANVDVDTCKQGLESAKAIYEEQCVFSEDALNKVRKDADRAFNPYTRCSHQSFRPFILKLQSMIEEGFKYVDEQGLAGAYPNSFSAQLIKPPTTIDVEKPAFIKNAEQVYMESLNVNKEPLLVEIAKAELKLKAAEDHLKKLLKEESDFEKQLHLVKTRYSK